MTTAAPAISLDYNPTPRQRLLHQCGARQIFYGGAAGGGKSHAIRMDAILLCLANPGLQAYLFRKTLPELEANHLRVLRALPRSIGIFHETRKEFVFTNGSILTCGYAEREKDIWDYRGKEMHVVLVDEASLMTPMQLGVLRAWNRLGGFKPAPGYADVLPRCVFASNPGGPAHNYLKRTFILPSTPETIFYDPEMRDPRNAEDKGWTTCFIPATMYDNPHLDANYAANFGAMPPEQRRAFVDGDWDAVVGAALHTLSRDRHLVRPFVPPRHWTRAMSLDWGTARPFSAIWWTVSDGALLAAQPGWPDVWLPPGAVIAYREFYGWTGKENEGCRMPAAAVARRILEIEREANEPPIDLRVADNQMWAQTDGATPAEHMIAEGVFVTQGKKDRKAAYAEWLARLAGSPTYMQDGKAGEAPMIYITADCAHMWRTLPSLTVDEVEPDKGPDTKLEDHCYDSAAFFLRSRPYVSTVETRYEEERAVIRGIMAQGRRGDPYAQAG